MPERDVITDEMWARMEPLLPSSAGKRGGQYRDHRVLHADEVEELGWDVSVDSSIVRTHQHAAGARTVDADDTGGSSESHESAARAA